MSFAGAERESTFTRRMAPLVVFLFSSSILFELPFFTFNSDRKWFQIVIFVSLPLFFSVLAAFVRYSRRFMDYWPALCSYVIVSIALLLMWFLDDFPLRWLGLRPREPSGRAVVKLSDAIILLLSVVVVGKLLRIDFDSIYLQKGRRRLGLAIGLVGFVVMVLFALVDAHGMSISNRRILVWAPWIFTFVLANGFLEELMFRGLFLRKFEPLLRT